MKEISPILKAFGLLDSEIKTYLVALESGPQTAQDLTKRTRLSRQAIYTAIESLVRRGLMTSVLRHTKRLYSAEHPDRLLAYARRRETKLKDYIRDLERAIPELELQMGGERPIVRVLEGKEGVQALLEQTATKRTPTFYEIADYNAMIKVLDLEDLRPLREAIDRNGIKAIGLVNRPPFHNRPNIEHFLLPEEFRDFRCDIFVFGDHIGLVTFEGKIYSIIIEHKKLARALEILFVMATRAAERIPKKPNT